ncbi:hypothetical protein NTE_02615 [Candidatus Nitrososphaera evergladensis SR1]|uniref:Uncharacterized protein n=1 Tax=Candidatus Nitrososphaera evergladensis SR1 TaxID=1459636 RepID=A0A075MU25_9ARCH|nr:hypothetical protein NTE_02615 [Candidatus Nitrososphaera evergladensis SR1]
MMGHGEKIIWLFGLLVSFGGQTFLKPLSICSFLLYESFGLHSKRRLVGQMPLELDRNWSLYIYVDGVCVMETVLRYQFLNALPILYGFTPETLYGRCHFYCKVVHIPCRRESGLT